MQEEMLELLIDIGHLARVQRRFDDARYLFERLATVYPQRAFPYFGLGLVEVDRARYRKASILLERAVAMAPGQALPRAWLGACLLFEKKYAAGTRMLMTVTDSEDAAASELAAALLNLPECTPYRTSVRPKQSAPTLQQLTDRQRQ